MSIRTYRKHHAGLLVGLALVLLAVVPAGERDFGAFNPEALDIQPRPDEGGSESRVLSV